MVEVGGGSKVGGEGRQGAALKGEGEARRGIGRQAEPMLIAVIVVVVIVVAVVGGAWVASRVGVGARRHVGSGRIAPQ